MKKITTLFTALLFGSTLMAQTITKVACIGNSITYGSGVVNREMNSYPAQLQTYLTDQYQVENFGVGGTTTLSQGNNPYIKTPEFKKSLEFNPDIVIIKLGTNDSKAINFEHIENFKADYQNIIDQYKNLETTPRIILISPIKCFLTDPQSISDSRMQEIITPIIEELAIENDLEIINGYPLIGTTYVEHHLPDRLHPSSIGAGMIAKHLYQIITVESDENKIEWQKSKADKISSLGYHSWLFWSRKGINHIVIEPHRQNKQKTWAVSLSTPKERLMVEKQLLELGYHIVYIDQSDYESSAESPKEFEKTYNKLQKMGLSDQFTIINKGKTVGLTNQMDLTQEIANQAIQFKEEELSKATAYIHKAQGIAQNLCTHPIRGNQYLAAAGWHGGAEWNQVADDITNTLANNHFDVLMLGNSITQGMATHRKLVGSCWNNQTLREIFKGRSWESAGISGDRTQHLLWRLQNGEYNKATPNYVTIAIGVNNAEDDAESVYEGILAVTQAALKEFSQAQIILFGMLPTAGSEERVTKYNKIIEMLTVTDFENKRVHFVDPRPYFTTPEGELREDLYRPDNIHIIAKGFEQWAKLIVETIEEIEK